MPLRDICTAGDDLTVFHTDFEDTRHFVKSSLLRFRVYIEVDSPQQFLHVGTLNDSIGEFV
jgi:hypothetical protein